MNNEEHEILNKFFQRESEAISLEKDKEIIVVPEYFFNKLLAKQELDGTIFAVALCSVYDCDIANLRDEMYAHLVRLKNKEFQRYDFLCTKEHLLEKFCENLDVYETLKNAA